MKLKKRNKILLASLITTTGVCAVVGVGVTAAGLISEKTTRSKSISEISSTQSTSSIGKQEVTGSGFGFKITRVSSKDSTSESSDKTSTVAPSEMNYVLTVDKNISKEGVISLLDKDGNECQQLEFIPGQTIQVVFKLYQEYENTHTVRELKTYSTKSPNNFVASKKVKPKLNRFEITMPRYEDTLIKGETGSTETKESWFYDPAYEIKVEPSFIIESIGVNGNDVNWNHGAFQGSMNGYVYELTEDTKWTQKTKDIYETFKNEDITNPIDIYFYLNGHTLEFDVEKINLDIPSGWCLHFYNNKTDSKAANGKYGELKVSGAKKRSDLDVKGAVVLGSSVKFRHFVGTDGIVFIDYDDTTWIVDDIKNDPEVRLGGK